MAQYSLEEVLSMYGRIPEMRDSEFVGLRYTTMVAYAPKTENGNFLIELARAGLARVFLQELQDWQKRSALQSSASSHVFEVAHALADEYVDAMLERHECIETQNTTYMNMITSALTMCTSRFVKHSFREIARDDLSQKWRKFHVDNPDAYGPALLAWFNRPIPL